MAENFGTTRYEAPGQVLASSTVSRTFLFNVYNWMALGLAITALVSYFVARSETLMALFFGNPVLLIGVIIMQFVVVLALSFALNKIPPVVAVAAFFFYAALTGITFAALFIVYTGASIASTFFICAGMFAGVSVFGYITKMDLSGMGTFLFMALIGLILASVVNIFLSSSTLYWIISYAGVLIFVGLTAYDTQQIKKMSMNIDADSDQGKRAAIFGALKLYLDFINLFLFLLRIMGDRR